MALKPTITRGKTGSKSLQIVVDDLAALDSHTVAELEALTPADHAGVLVYCTDGAAGAPCLAYCDGTAWLRVLLGAAVAAS